MRSRFVAVPAAVALATATAVAMSSPPARGAPDDAREPDLGANVIVFDPSMPTSRIQSTVDAIAEQQVSDQFGSRRYALLFEPGSYGSADDPLNFEVGYYTEVAGLGRSPGDVVIHGSVDVFNQCLPTGDPATTNCTALVNFWRSMSNLTIDVTRPDSGCRTDTEFWAVSQAAPLRRVDIVGGGTSLMDYCTAGPQFASGGFIADSNVDATVVNGSQQQFLVRDSSIGGWSNAVWNQVFAGVQGAPAQSFPQPPYTTLATVPVSREKPYPYVDGRGRLNVFVPDAETDSTGTTWADGQTPGRSIPIERFFVADPSDSVSAINSQLARGRNLLLTPGVYDIDRTIEVKRPDTVVLGLGMATLTARGGVVPMRVANVRGVAVAGLMFDAGPVNSPVLLAVGTRHEKNGDGHRPDSWSDPADPTVIQDVFFRIGGPHAGRATVSLEVDSDDVILDDIWAWRADHGSGVGWTSNTADTGVVVNGDAVTATGLFVEHYQKYDVIWNGEDGRTVMFQNEMPYDPPSQQAWRHDGVLGYAAYKVADDVDTHEAWGLGSYIFTNVDPSIHASRAFEVPVTPGVRLHDLLTVSLNRAGTIDHVVNDTGAPVTPDFAGPSDVVTFP